MSAGSAFTVQCASIQCTQREFKWLLSLTCLLPKLALCTANYSHSQPEWSICISESKKRRGATGTVNQQMNTAYWLCGGCVVPVCEFLIVVKWEQLWWTQQKKQIVALDIHITCNMVRKTTPLLVSLLACSLKEYYISQNGPKPKFDSLTLVSSGMSFLSIPTSFKRKQQEVRQQLPECTSAPSQSVTPAAQKVTSAILKNSETRVILVRNRL